MSELPMRLIESSIDFLKRSIEEYGAEDYVDAIWSRRDREYAAQYGEPVVRCRTWPLNSHYQNAITAISFSAIRKDNNYG